MITALFNYMPKDLSKEQVIAEFKNLPAWEQTEVLEYLLHAMKYEKDLYLVDIPTDSLCNELENRGIKTC